MSKTDIKRRDEYVKLREQGMTYQAIADMYGVSRQCIEQLINRSRVRKSEKVKEYQRKYYKEHREQCLERVRRWKELHPNYSKAYYRTHYVSKKIKKDIDKE